MEKLDREFYDRDTVTVARDLLGKLLVRELDGHRLVGRITETEAYVGPIDKACHAYNYKRTPRTETLFSPPGTAYIYLIYGMYHCLNFVTEAEGTPCAVLIRGLSPVENEAQMALNRFGRLPGQLSSYQRKNFLNGPGKLCKALQLDRSQNGLDLTGDTLFAEGYGRCDLYGGSIDRMRASLKLLRTLPQNMRIYPGHGAPEVLGTALDMSAFFY